MTNQPNNLWVRILGTILVIAAWMLPLSQIHAATRPYYQQFGTPISNQNLDISNIQPSNPSGEGINAYDATVRFDTNHGSYSGVRYGFDPISLNQQIANTTELAYSHSYILRGLVPNSLYYVELWARDLSGHTQTTLITIRTDATGNNIPAVTPVVLGAATGPNGDIAYQTTNPTCTGDCAAIAINSGWYAQYFQHNKNEARYIDKTLTNQKELSLSSASHWFSGNYRGHIVSQPALSIQSPLPAPSNSNDSLYFTAHWTTNVYIPEQWKHKWSLRSNQRSWVVIDGQVVASSAQGKNARDYRGVVDFSPGWHRVEIFYASHGVKPSVTWQWLTEITPHSPAVIASTNTPVVLGASFESFTPAHYLVRSTASNTVYAVFGNQKMPLPNEYVFHSYGYNWDHVHITDDITTQQLNWVQVVKSQDNDAVYLVHHGQRTKQAFATPSAFNRNGYNWDDIVTITPEHLQWFVNTLPTMQ